ncbi:MAG: VWA domain-containing protein [Candidatus Aenigmatarchaeota archaeon]
MRKILIITGIILLSLTACDSERLEKAKTMMAQDESTQDIQIAILFDNSISYKPHIEDTLLQVKGVFQYMAAKYPGAETSIIMVDTKANIIYSGLSKDLQRAYDDLVDKLRNETTQFTNLTDAVNKALYFLEKGKAHRKVMLIFSDMKHSMPDYYPQDIEVVPPPPDFPLDGLKGVETYAFYVPYKEWRLWRKTLDEKGVIITAKLPEELKSLKVTQIIFKED